MRRLLSLGFVALALSGQDTLDWQRIAANRFYSHFSRYYRELFACPEGNVWYDPHTQCGRGGKLDYAEFTRARREAVKLFDLRER